MSKPDDIPQDVWDDAQMLLQETLDEYVPDFVTEAVARAIIAAKAEEREACAQFLNDRAEEWRAVGTVTGNTFGNIYDDEAASIRKRGEP